MNITEAATIGKGITGVESAEKKELIGFYDAEKEKYSILKFVPASGAASRMFNALHNFADKFDPEKQQLRVYLDEAKDADLQKFSNNIDKLPFYEKVQTCYQRRWCRSWDPEKNIQFQK